MYDGGYLHACMRRVQPSGFSDAGSLCATMEE
jgi:hypothetical protein